MKAGIIKSVSIGSKRLEHSRYYNAVGFLVDMFDVISTDEKGFETHRPMFPPPKVNNYTKNTPINLVNDYSEEEMLEVLKEKTNPQ